MQQRQLRLGDILDDYCPRERRLANHTVVAMVGNDVRLTRCTTCDTEHPYKGGKVPRLRKKKTSVEAAYDEVLESVKQDTPLQAVLVTNPDTDETEASLSADEAQTAPPAHSDNGNASPKTTPEEVRLHRPLIRAQLPRIEREPIARPAPEFTIRQANKGRGRFQNNNTRPGRFAKSGGGGQGGNSRGPMGGQGGRQGGGRPQGHGGPMRPAGGRPQGHGGPRKRSR
jgi:hypothetical protein